MMIKFINIYNVSDKYPDTYSFASDSKENILKDIRLDLQGTEKEYLCTLVRSKDDIYIPMNFKEEAKKLIIN